MVRKVAVLVAPRVQVPMYDTLWPERVMDTGTLRYIIHGH